MIDKSEDILKAKFLLLDNNIEVIEPEHELYLFLKAYRANLANKQTIKEALEKIRNRIIV